MRIILASSSPRRQQLLTQIGLSYEVIESGIDETESGPARKQVEALAAKKAFAVASKIEDEAIIIAADTLVTIDGRVLSKPADTGEAFDMLKSLQGRKHTVYTGVALLRTDDALIHIVKFVEDAAVHFRPLSDNEIRSYIATGEPFDKAGAYGIQGYGAMLTERIEGDFYTVMGLPLSRLCVELDKLGVDIFKAKKGK